MSAFQFPTLRDKLILFFSFLIFLPHYICSPTLASANLGQLTDTPILAGISLKVFAL